MNLHPVIIISGYAASGKTTLARLLAQNINYEFVDLGSIIRFTTLQYLQGNLSDWDLTTDETRIQQFLENLQLHPQLVSEGQIGFGSIRTIVNGQYLSIDDPTLREPVLDTITLPVARLIRSKLIEYQRAVAKLTPVVFSARNAAAFSKKESIRIHIDPGMTTRIRRRAQAEGFEWSQLNKQQRRDLIQRIVGKEWESMQLGVATPLERLEQEGFVIFRNRDNIETSLNQLTQLAISLLKERGWYPNIQREGNIRMSFSKERV